MYLVLFAGGKVRATAEQAAQKSHLMGEIDVHCRIGSSKAIPCRTPAKDETASPAPTLVSPGWRWQPFPRFGAVTGHGARPIGVALAVSPVASKE